MDKNQLLESAIQLQKVSDTASAEYQTKADQLIHEMNTLMLERPDLESLIGENNTTMMKDNHSNHVRFMASILANHNPEVLVETVLWVFRAYRSHGFSTNYWAAQLNSWITLLKENLSPESYKEVSVYYEWMQINIPYFVILSDEKLDASNSLH